jgi:hypothetical protein
MSTADDRVASEAARALARSRWGSAKVDRAAAVVIERHAELDAARRAEVHEITAPDPDAGRDDHGWFR